MPKAMYVSAYFLDALLFFVGFASAIAIFTVRPRPVAQSVFSNPELGRGKATLYLLITFVLLGGFYFTLFSRPSSTAEEITSVVANAEAAQLVRTNTIQRLEHLADRYRVELDDIYSAAYAAEIEPEIRSAFDELRSRVPEFIAWYFSLGADFGRTAALVGSLFSRDRGADDMSEYLEYVRERGDPFSDLNTKLEMLDQVQSTLRDRFERDSDEIISTRLIEPPKGIEMRITKSVAQSDLRNMLGPGFDALESEIRDVQRRLGIATAVGVTSGVGATVVTHRLLSRAASKASPKALAALAPLVGVSGGGLGLLTAVVVTAGVEVLLLEVAERRRGPELEAALMKAIATAETELLSEFETLLSSTHDRI